MRGKSEAGEVSGFEWIRDSVIDEAGCLTLVRSSDADQVAAAFGGISQGAQPLDFEEFCEEAFAYHDKYPVIGVRQVGDWTFVVEDNGFEGARPEVLRRVSRGTETVSALWDLSGLTRFSYAASGEILTAFEAQLPEYREGTRPDTLEPFRAGLPWNSGNPAQSVPLMLALIARVTGQEITSGWFDGEFATYPVAAWPEDLPVTVGAVRGPLDAEFPAELVTAAHLATRDSQRRAAAEIARHALELTRIDDHPEVRQVLAGLGEPGQLERAALDEAVRTWTWVTRAERVTDNVRRQVRALETLRQATNPDALVAVFATLNAAAEVRGVDPDDAQGRVRRVLAAES